MARKPRRPDVEFDHIEQRGAEDLTMLFETHLRAIASGDPERRDRSVDDLAVAFGNMLAFGDLLGRRRSLLEGKAIEGKLTDEERMYFQAFDPPDKPVPKTSGRTPHRLPYRPYDIPGLTTVGFEQAAENLSTRVPELAMPQLDGQPLYKAVQALYQTEHAFSLAHAAHLALAGRMQEAMRVTAVTQEALERSLKYGISGAKFERAMADMHGFSASYSETVFRTSMKRSYSEGRKTMIAEDSTLSYVLPAFEFFNPGDASSRPNHAACSGIVAAQDSPLWKTLTPPLGYNCRCTMLSVNRYDLKRRKLLDEKTGIVREHVPKKYFRDNGGPDEGFGATGPGPAPYSGTPQMSVNQAWQRVSGRGEE